MAKKVNPNTFWRKNFGVALSDQELEMVNVLMKEEHISGGLSGTLRWCILHAATCDYRKNKKITRRLTPRLGEVEYEPVVEERERVNLGANLPPETPKPEPSIAEPKPSSMADIIALASHGKPASELVITEDIDDLGLDEIKLARLKLRDANGVPSGANVEAENFSPASEKTVDTN